MMMTVLSLTLKNKHPFIILFITYSTHLWRKSKFNLAKLYRKRLQFYVKTIKTLYFYRESCLYTGNFIVSFKRQNSSRNRRSAAPSESLLGMLGVDLALYRKMRTKLFLLTFLIPVDFIINGWEILNTKLYHLQNKTL